MSLRSPYDIRSDKTELILHVRPMKNTGVLFYTDSESSGDFLGLALDDGYLVYRLVLPYHTPCSILHSPYSTPSYVMPCNTIPYTTTKYRSIAYRRSIAFIACLNIQ